MCLFLGLVGGVAYGWPGAVAGTGVGAALGFLWVRREADRTARRRAVAAGPFPPRWRAILAHRYDHYDRLPETLRPAFEARVQAFLAEKRITGVEVAITDELRVLVAASAATLSFAWGAYPWDQLAEVLLYAKDFDRDYSFEGRELAGEAHPWGTIIISVPTLQQSFDDPDDGYHVGLHEFAHLLDKWGSHFDGILPGLDEARSREWIALAEREMERMRRGQSVIDPYGAGEPGRVPRRGGRGLLRAPARPAAGARGGVLDAARLLRPGSGGLGRRAGPLGLMPLRPKPATEPCIIATRWPASR